MLPVLLPFLPLYILTYTLLAKNKKNTPIISVQKLPLSMYSCQIPLVAGL